MPINIRYPNETPLVDTRGLERGIAGLGQRIQQGREDQRLADLEQQNATQGADAFSRAIGENGEFRPDPEAMRELLRNPTTRSIAVDWAKSRMQPEDPDRDLKRQKLEAEIHRLRNPVSGGGGGGDGPRYGLSPQTGVDENGNPVLIQLGDDGTAVRTPMPEGVSISKAPIRLDAGTEFILLDPITRQPVGRIPKDLTGAERQKVAGKDLGEADALLDSMTSKMPGLEGVVDELGSLADDATYTAGGRALDETRKQLGMEPRPGAVARSSYTAIVDNQILPLLRDTFGAQFTVAEGESLRATLGDPNKTPTEKKAVLNAFIAQKRRDVEALSSRTQQAPVGGAKRLRFNPATGELE